MNRLLVANFARLWRSRIFYVLEIFMIGYSVLIYTDTYITVRKNHKVYENWNLFFFNEMLFIGVALAVFVSLYIGVEYSNGTIRNKLSAGHSRLHIYLANLLVCYAAGTIACITYSVTSAILGLALIGKEAVGGLWKPVQGMVVVLFILLAYVAIFVLVSMTDMNTVRASVVSLMLSFVILCAGLYVCQYLSMTATIERVTEVEDEYGELKTVVETEYNARYLSGTKRKIYECAELLLPSGQVMYVADRGINYSVKQPLYMFGVSAICTGAGIWIFRNKDIK